MRAKRPLGARTRAAIGAWMPIDGSQLALLVIVALIGVLFTMLAH
jgi:hypothetical protein